jgi:hypothetical protein
MIVRYQGNKLRGNHQDGYVPMTVHIYSIKTQVDVPTPNSSVNEIHKYTSRNTCGNYIERRRGKNQGYYCGAKVYWT